MFSQDIGNRSPPGGAAHIPYAKQPGCSAVSVVFVVIELAQKSTVTADGADLRDIAVEVDIGHDGFPIRAVPIADIKGQAVLKGVAPREFLGGKS